MKKIFMIFGMLCGGIAAHAQAGILKGKVVNHDGSPASNVSISIDDNDTEVLTDDNGVFELEGKAGKHELVIHAVGSGTETITVMIADDKTTTLRDIHLRKGNLELEEVVIGGQRKGYNASAVSNSLRLETPLLETPQNIQVVTNKVLLDQQISSMSDGVVRNVSGVTRLEHWGDMYTRINGRGSRLSAFRNGMNITSNWGPLTEDMSFVDHIEFVKGPAGFMMSNGEPSGMYNVVTKKPTGETKGEAGIMFGSYDFYRANVDLDGKFDKAGKVLYRLNLMGQTKNSFREYEYNNRYSIAPVLTYRLSDKTTLTAEYIFQYAKMSNVGSYYVFATDGYAKLPRNFTLGNPGIDPTTINDHNITATLQHRFNDSWRITGQASYFNYQQTGSSMWPTSVDSLGNIVRNVSIWDASNIMKFGQLFLNGDVHTGPVHHRILAGLDMGDKQYYADWGLGWDLDTVGSFNVHDPNYGVPVRGYPNRLFDARRDTSLAERAGAGGTLTQTYTGVYLQDELGFFEDKLRLTLAGRYTYVKTNNYSTITTGKQLTPRIGLSYSIDKETAVYALYDQTFVPQAGIRRDMQPVKALTGNNMEIGVKKDWFGGRLSTTLSAYRILKNNQTSNDPSNTAGENFVVQFGQTRTQGIELDVRGEILPGLTLVANYAYTDSKITKADSSEAAQKTVDNNVPGYSKHTANAWVNYKIQDGALKGFGISGGFTYMGERSTWTWTGASGLIALPDYFRLDGSIFYEKNRIRITASLLNIADEYLYSGAAYATYYYWQAEPGRNWRVGVTYRF